MRYRQIALAGMLLIGATIASRATPTFAAAKKPADKPSIVLVHGAFADGSGWSEVIRILQKKGYNVTAVQNPLSSYAADMETTKRLVDAQPGPVVLVGHSYGGAVITGVSGNDAKVKALVYVAAFAPDANEPIGAYLERYPSLLGGALRPDAAGFAYIDRASFRKVFAADVPEDEANVMAAAQKPAIGTAFGSSPTAAGWRSIPSWYIVSQDDNAINPDLERFFAKRMGAKTTEIKASHVVFISHPKEVAGIIEEAAAAVAAGR